ncbi:MAG TPA: hypothetical protein VF746_23630, partial [Longimicrobium sp.]
MNRIRLQSLVGASLFVLAGCGGDAGEDTETAAPAPAPAAAPGAAPAPAPAPAPADAQAGGAFLDPNQASRE